MHISEKFIKFAFYNRLYEPNDIYTTDGKKVVIKSPGFINNGSGPDFLNAHICIDNMDFFGHIEVDVLSSLWEEHKHHKNEEYRSVCLHVVWENDKSHDIPTVEIKNFIPLNYLEKYNAIVDSFFNKFIPCEQSIGKVSIYNIEKMFLNAIKERLLERINQIRIMVDNEKGDYESAFLKDVLMYLLPINVRKKIRQFIFDVNVSVVNKHRGDLLSIISIISGQLGVLNRVIEFFPENLRKTLLNFFNEYKEKYMLKVLVADFSKERHFPASKIEKRILEYCALVTRNNFYLSDIIDELKALKRKGNSVASHTIVTSKEEFYKTITKMFEYNKDDCSIVKIRPFSKDMVVNLMVNVVIPYTKIYGNGEDIIELLEFLPIENNSIVRKWRNLGIKLRNCLHSQGAIFLKRYFCDERKCWYCSIFAEIMLL